MDACIVAAAAGIAAHRSVFIKGEWHLWAPYVVVVHASALAVALGYTREFYRPVLLGNMYLLGLFGSMLVYRMFFHKLRHFPGPSGAAVSKLWHVWKCRDSRNHEVLDAMYKRYGQFVRTGMSFCHASFSVGKSRKLMLSGPNEITIFHPAAYEAMDGPGNDMTRSDWYDIIHPRTSPIFSRRPTDHLNRRQAWQKALSSKGKSSSSFKVIHCI